MNPSPRATDPFGGEFPTEEHLSRGDGHAQGGADLTNTVESRHFDLPHALDVRPTLSPSHVRDRSRYEIVGEHGRGGLGRVLRAHDKEIGRDVAVKELLKRGPRAEERFLRESLITARLEHPGIVPVHETGRWPDGTPFYSMKLVSGRPMSAVLAEAKTTSERLGLLSHVVAVADAIAYAHSRRIIHRDIKPSNVIVGDFGETVVIDWGLAKHVTEPHQSDLHDGPYRNLADGSELTVAGSVLGTPAYMSPEQARGEPVDERCDVYSIGAMLFVLATGSPPTVGSATSELRRCLRHLDEDFGAIAVKALSAAPEHRYRDAGDLAADLRAYVAGARIAARHYSLGGLLALWVRRHKQLASAVVIAAIVTLGIGAISIREVIGQRDRANRSARATEKALDQAEAARDQARISEARMLLDVDPTAARAAVADLDSFDAALLLARAEGLGVADRTIRVRDHRILEAAPTINRSHVAVTTAGRALHLINLESGEIHQAARGLPEPPVLVFDPVASRWHFPIVEGHRSVLTTIGKDGAPSAASFISALDHPPTQLVTLAGFVAALHPDGSLVSYPSSTPPVLLHDDVRAVVPFADGLLVCLRSQRLILLRESSRQSLGRCADTTTRSSMASSGRSLVAPLDSGHIRVVSNGSQRDFPMATNEVTRIAISEEGGLGAIDAHGRTWYRMPGDEVLRHGERSGGAPSAVTVAGQLVAWGFTDGSLSVLDTGTGASRYLYGHNASVVHLFADEKGRRIVSIGGNEVRTWSLRSRPWRRLARLGCAPFNAVLDESRQRVAFDCADGSVHIMTRASGVVSRLHKHDVLGFGVAFVGERVCSSGWDGRVLCTPATGGKTIALATYAQPVRWVSPASETGAFAYAVADGGVWYVPPGAEPRLLHTHRGEPYRVAIDPTGMYVASGDHDGNLMVTALEPSSEKTTEIAGHQGLVTAVAWSGQALVSLGDDGVAAEWSRSLVQYEQSQHPAFLKHLTVFGSGRAAALGTDSMWMRAEDGRERTVDVGAQVTAIGAWGGANTLAAGTSKGELLVVDASSIDAPRFASMPIDDGKIVAVRFADPSTLIVATSTGSIYDISLEHLTLVAPKGNVR